MKGKMIIRTMLIYIFTALLIAVPGLADKIEPANNCRLSPLNPDFLKYIDARQRSIQNMPFDQSHSAPENGHLLGGVPAVVDLSHIRGTIDEAVNIQYPYYYDLRQMGRVSEVKNQGSYYTCWIFAAFCSLESCLLPEVVDFSEWHMAIAHGFDYSLDEGGNSFMTTAYLVRQSGPIDENELPYASTMIPAPLYPLSKHVQQVIYLPEREGPLDNNTIKYFLMTYGPVDFAYFWEFTNFNETTNSIYTPGNGGQNHRLTIVGWNDNYPASRFTFTPPGNGAFIARNSWGTSWGEQGYCYISYYDDSFQQFMSFNNAEPPNNYGTVYQYDPLGHTQTWGTMESWGANVFKAENRNPLPLMAVGFFTADAGVKYEIYVYTNVNSLAGNPTSGDLAAVKTGGLTYAGYYTIKLDSPVSLARDETFSVVVKFSNSKYPFSVPIENPIQRHSSRASANPGESYVSLNGSEWQDLTRIVPNANVCIKAYAQFKNPYISIQGKRENIQCWIIRRDYGVITIHVDHLQDEPVSKLILYRSAGGNDYVALAEIGGDQLAAANGDFSYIDKYLDNFSYYNYKAMTYDVGGLVLETSAPVNI